MTQIDASHAADIAAIKALIQAFFDSINASDTASLQTHFRPGATLTIIKQDPPLPPTTTSDSSSLQVVMRNLTIEKFIDLLNEGEKRRKGQPPGPVLVETPDLPATKVHVDALVAVAWSPFRVTFDGVLHHYGTMMYTLVQQQGGGRQWKIEGLTQSYRRTPGWPESSHGTSSL